MLCQTRPRNRGHWGNAVLTPPSCLGDRLQSRVHLSQAIERRRRSHWADRSCGCSVDNSSRLVHCARHLSTARLSHPCLHAQLLRRIVQESRAGLEHERYKSFPFPEAPVLRRHDRKDWRYSVAGPLSLDPELPIRASRAHQASPKYASRSRSSQTLWRRQLRERDRARRWYWCSRN